MRLSCALWFCNSTFFFSFSRAGSFNSAERIVIIIVTLFDSFTHLYFVLASAWSLNQRIPQRFVCKWNARVLPLHRTFDRGILTTHADYRHKLIFRWTPTQHDGE